MDSAPLQKMKAELPTPRSTHSYWLRDPSRKLTGHRTTESLPSTADVVVVGSGITGTFAAQELVAGGRSVVMLEAREACSGATGRSGGHCQPGVWDSSPEVARFELATFDLISGLVAKHSIPCDWHVVGGVHAIYSQTVLEAAKKQIARLQRHPDLRGKALLVVDRAELVAKRVPDTAIAAVYQPSAAKCWPYKLVAWLLERLLNEHDAATFNLQTNTPVTRLRRCGGDSSWIVHTERGQVQAREVLLATNAYTSRVLPGLTNLIIPVRGQIAALEASAEAVQLSHSYVWMKGADHQYLIQRGPEDQQVNGEPVNKALIFGGERLAVPGGEEGISRDDEVDPTISKALREFLDRAVDIFPKDKREGQELRATYEWTGIMGYSRDESPWVGRVPETLVRGLDADAETSPGGGLWISAGYSGHGMPVAARCGVAVAQMMLGGKGDVKAPEQWLTSEERLKRAKESDIPRTVEDMMKSLLAGSTVES